jgi:CRP-like cAMP-binding protein
MPWRLSGVTAMDELPIRELEEEDGPRELIAALRSQKIVGGHSDLAVALAEVVELLDVPAGETLIRQGDTTNDMFMLLSGALSIQVDGAEVARRYPGYHVGEQALIDPFPKRTATVVTVEPSMLCRVTEEQVDRIARQYPVIWKNIARELSRRLVEQNEASEPFRRV